jgi:hypothetical protein
MAIEVATITLPAFLADALVHGDLGRLDDTGLRIYASVVDHLDEGGWYVVDVARDDDGKSQHFRLNFGTSGSIDVQDYVIHRTGSMENVCA